jgi:hypothetical protein
MSFSKTVQGKDLTPSAAKVNKINDVPHVHVPLGDLTEHSYQIYKSVVNF